MYTFWIKSFPHAPCHCHYHLCVCVCVCVCVLIFLLSSLITLMLLILLVVKIHMNRIIFYVFFHDSFLSTLSLIFIYVDAQIIIYFLLLLYNNQLKVLHFMFPSYHSCTFHLHYFKNNKV